MTSDVQTPLPALPIGPAGAGKWDIRLALAAAGVFLLHVVLVVISACPFWTMCFPLPKIGGFLWVTGALESGLDQATATGVVPVRVLSEANTRRGAARREPRRPGASPSPASPSRSIVFSEISAFGRIADSIPSRCGSMWLYLPGAFAYIRAAMNLSHDLQYAVDLARASGKIILDQYGKVERLTKTNSASTDEAVTVADRASQRAIVAGLRVRFPDDGIVGEESETGESITFETKNPGGRNWVIDPIDGTNNFIAGLGIFGVCIGLMDAGRPVLGVVYDVTRDVVYAAARGEGAWMGSRQIRVPKSPLDESSMIMFTSNLLTGGKCPAWAHKFLAQSTWKLRILGSAALEATYVAAGIAHGAVTVNGKLWDCAASAAIVLEAGGMLTDLRGNEIFPFDLTRYQGAKVPFLASAPQAHGELLEMIVSNS